MNKQWIVLYVKGGRIASRSISDKDILQKMFYYLLIQRDIDGSEHWEVMGMKRGTINSISSKIKDMEEMEKHIK